MEEEKKKRKGRKKKNKQNKTAEDLAEGVANVTSAGENHVIKNVKDGTPKDTETAEVQDDPVSVVWGDQESHSPNDFKIVGLGEIIARLQQEKEVHMQKEVVAYLMIAFKTLAVIGVTYSFLEQIKRLQNEKVKHIQKEAFLEEQILLLQKEKDMFMQKEVSLGEIIARLQQEKEVHMQKEGSFLEQIKHLQNDKVKHIQKEAFLEEQILLLRKEKDMFMQKEVSLGEIIAWLQQEKEVHMEKEVSFEQKINHLTNESTSLNRMKAHLEEMVKKMEGEIESWLQKENSNKEAIDCLNGHILRLQMQVAKLEQQRDSLSHENQLLTENISGLELQILNLERTAAVSSSTESNMHTIENVDVTSEIESARALVEKLITENAELVEKVNALYAEQKYTGGQKQDSPADSSFETKESARVGVNSDVLLVMDAEVDLPKNAPAADEAVMLVSNEITEVEKQSDKDAAKLSDMVLNTFDMSEPDGIVQISLDENESQTTDTGAVYTEEKTEVSISDAPLIGAPFRLISFVARYVTGADLVEKNSVSAGG